MMLITRKVKVVMNVGLCVAASLAMVVPVDAQNIRLQRQIDSPEPETPATELSASPAPRDQENTVCKGVQVYYTLRGLAFSCADFQAGTSYMMVIDDSQFSGGSAVAMVILDRAAEESKEYIADPQRPGTNLKVRHRQAGAKAIEVCRLTQGARLTTPCREVIRAFK